MTTWLPILTGLLTSLTALAGIWLGSRLTRAKDEQQWRRDRRLETYADIARGCQIVRYEADKLFHRIGDPIAQVEVLHERLSELYLVLERAILLAPTDIRHTCEELADLYGRVCAAAAKVAMNTDTSPDLSSDDWEKLIDGEAGALVGRFLEQARNDLLGGSRMKWKTLRLHLKQRRHHAQGGPRTSY